MSVLAIDGVPICDLDPETARWLLHLARQGPGYLSESPMIDMPKDEILGASPLARGALALRTFQMTTDLTLKIRFREVESVVQNIWPR